MSHDRDFLDRVVTSTLVFEGGGRVAEYVGGYSDWVRQRPAPAVQGRKAKAGGGEAKAGGTKGKPKSPPGARSSASRRSASSRSCRGASRPWRQEQAALHARLGDPAFYRDAGNAVANDPGAPRRPRRRARGRLRPLGRARRDPRVGRRSRKACDGLSVTTQRLQAAQTYIGQKCPESLGKQIRHGRCLGAGQPFQPGARPMRLRKYWIALAVVVGASFLVLGGEGVQLHHALPPVPGTVVGPAGRVVTTRAAIQRGQAVWESFGGQEMGSIWGHGAYVAPDWTADWLHREATFVLDDWARAEGATGFAALSVEQQGALKARLEPTMRHEHLRRQDRHGDPAGGARRRLRRPLAPLRRGVHRGEGGLRDPGEDPHRPLEAHGPRRLLLVDQLGRQHRPPWLGRHLHPELAPRGAGGQRRHRR